MIKRCKLPTGHIGTYINGVVEYKYLGKTYGCKYDKEKHVVFDDPVFDKRITLYREIITWLKLHGVKNFYKSVVHKSLPQHFGNYKTWCGHVKEMLELNILVRNRDYLTLGEIP